MDQGAPKEFGVKTINTNTSLIEWLLENGGPVIRYRTAAELSEEPESVNLHQFVQDLIQSQIVKTWLERLGPIKDFDQIHSSKATAYENVMGKLVQLGCHNGIMPFDEKTRRIRESFKLQPVSSEFDWTPFRRMIVGSFLVIAGYHQEEEIRKYLAQRLETLWEFTREKNFNIYADRDQYPDIPAGFRNKPLVKPELYAGGEERFPTIYDIHALANYPAQHLDKDVQKKVDGVIEYVLHPKYQAFPEGYGLMRAGKRKYYAIGWSVHLPKYHPSTEKSYDENRLIQRLVLMANFRAARKHPWFTENAKKLEEYRTDHGTFIFPRSYLPERKSGYWVEGAYMGLEENRRKRTAIELESTFWMLKIRKNARI